MKLVFVGLSITSSWGNGHATTYRSLLRALAARGHDVTFFEWDAPWYGGENRDLPDPDFCELVLYDDWRSTRRRVVAEAHEADGLIFGSYVHEGPRVLDSLLDAGLDVHFYDIDTPVTVAQLRRGEEVSLRMDQVPSLTTYLSFTGGPFLYQVLERELGAPRALPLYCSVDADRYRPVQPIAELRGDLAYMGTYAPDRQPGLQRLLLEPARTLRDHRFVVAGPQYPDTVEWPGNVARFDHVPPARHPAFYSSARWQLNLTRADMRRAGWSPSVRLFEAAACGAAMISDSWPGLDHFFRPGEEILLPSDGDEVRRILTGVDDEERRAIGEAARERVLSAHTSGHRASELEAIVAGAAPTARAEADGHVATGRGLTVP